MNRCIHQIFEIQAEKTPDAVAVVFEGEQLTYRELNQRANQLAHYLQSIGVGPDVLVGIAVKRSLEMVVGLYGILKSGGAYVPIDPAYPPERIAYMLKDTRVTVLLTQSTLISKLSQHEGNVICLDTDWDDLMACHSMKTPVCEATMENLAYVIYTSGSTGNPKGVMNTHKGILNRLLWMQDTFQLTSSDRVLQKTPFCFDVSVWEFFWPLMFGSSLVVARPEGHKDNNYLIHSIKDYQITTIHFVPSMLHLFLDAKDVEKCDSLRQVICSGEALTVDLQNRYFAKLGARLHNLYGPTEAAVDVTHWECRRENDLKIVPIGRPIANTQIYILDQDNQPVPIGDTGEIHIGGVQVARGYLNRPELTNEKFIPDPFKDNPDARLYKTGDLGRYLPDGNIEYLSRIDNQVKIRGFRIELGEIEAVLSRHESVGQCVVAVIEDDPGDERLAAYIVKKHSNKVTVTELQRFIQSKLPEYMVPQYIIELNEMSLTPNGKVDRKALPHPEQRRPEISQSYVEPQSKLERYLANIWCNILKLDRVGVHDRFFELGGTSIQAAQFIGRLQDDLCENIYIVSIFEAPTIAEYAQFLQKNYCNALTEKLGIMESYTANLQHKHISLSGNGKIDLQMIERMREVIPTLPQYEDKNDDYSKNPPVIFILAPPRSGTTLLRVMLAGHPRLFAAAELQLLGFNTLKERRDAFQGKFSLWLEGTIRAIMEIKGCDAAEAATIMEGYEKLNSTTKQFYMNLQKWIGDRILVDKSPSYVFDTKTLEKAELDFYNPLYIHLIRHPYAVVKSFENYHMDQVLYLKDHQFNPQELAELVWVISHQNTIQFLENVPDHRKFQMCFEDLVAQPKLTMEKMCDKLSLEFHSDLIRPYKDMSKKMTNGIYEISKPMGDTKLLKHGEINPKVAESWKGVIKDNFLSDITWEIAASLGYEYPQLSGDYGDSEIKDNRNSSVTRRMEYLRQRRDRRKN